MPLFSIIIPTYNSESTLIQCVNSVLNQSFTDFELIIVDGVSKDSTLKIVNDYQDNRIIILSEPDNGIYDAMNKGIKLSKGKWLYFLGSDDQMYNSSVLDLVSKIIENSNYNFIYGNIRTKNAQEIQGGIFTRQKLVTEWNICHQAIFYDKILFEQLGNYNLEFKVLADWDFNIRCFSYPEIQSKYIDTIIAVYEDITGVSKEIIEFNFLKLLPQYYIAQKALLKNELIIGKICLFPVRFIQKYLK